MLRMVQQEDGGSTGDERLWTVFQGLVNDHGRTRAARVLGVNYRTVVANLEAGRLSRRMRSALQALLSNGEFAARLDLSMNQDSGYTSALGEDERNGQPEREGGSDRAIDPLISQASR